MDILGERKLDRWILLFLLFLIYGFLGWLCESIYCSIPAKRLINRGFLTGPICPVYGVGGVLIILLLTPFEDNLFLLYFFGVLITSMVEYITGWLLEAVFHTRWWDYSNRRFQIQGRVCLRNSLLFGLMAVFLMRCIHPPVLRLLESIPEALLPWIAAVGLLCLGADTFLSIRTALQLSGKLQELESILEELRNRSEERRKAGLASLQQSLATSQEEFRSHLKERQKEIEKGLQLLQSVCCMPFLPWIPGNTRRLFFVCVRLLKNAEIPTKKDKLHSLLRENNAKYKTGRFI